MKCWIDVNNVNKLKVGDRVRLSDYMQVLREFPDQPSLGIGVSHDQKAYGLTGWSAYYKWMLDIDSTCKRVDAECADEGHNELDTLRLMCAALLKEKLGII